MAFTRHEGPIWELAWAYPTYGKCIATAGFDHYIKIWIYDQTEYRLAYQKDVGTQVNTITFGPYKFGFILAIGLDNGSIAIIYKQDKSFKYFLKEKAHNGAVNSISWAPEYSPFQIDNEAIENEKVRLKFVSGGSDTQVLIWNFDPSSQQYIVESSLKTENLRADVKSVCWSQNIALPYELIAVGCENKLVEVYKLVDGKWTYDAIKNLPGTVWCVDWSITGNMLSITSGDSTVKLYNESSSKGWEEIPIEEESKEQI